MMRSICPFSCSSSLSRTRSLTSSPAYLARHARSVFTCTPCLRASSVAARPASSSRRIATICASVKRLFRIGWVSFAGLLRGRKPTVSLGLVSGAQAPVHHREHAPDRVGRDRERRVHDLRREPVEVRLEDRDQHLFL